MAATPLRFLGQVAYGTVDTLESVKFALGHSLIGDCIEWDDWAVLNEADSIGRIKDLAEFFLPSYVDKWRELGKPNTAEEWHKARFASPA